eukprot:328031_1
MEPIVEKNDINVNDNNTKQHSNPTNYLEGIEMPPELVYYEANYDENDKKLEKYLMDKYENEIKSLNFFPDDIIVRFVLGYKPFGNGDYDKRVQKTDDIFHTYLEFGKNSDFDNITSEKYAKKFTKIPKSRAISGHDKYGHPILWDTGASCANGANYSYFTDGGSKAIDMYCAFMHKKLSEAKIHNNKHYKLSNKKIGIYKHIMVMDLKEFSASTVWKQLAILKQVNVRMSDVAPDVVYKIYLINVPWIFGNVWRMVKHFVDPHTRSLINMLGMDYIDQLTKEIDINMIPPEFGGKGVSPEYIC